MWLYDYNGSRTRRRSKVKIKITLTCARFLAFLSKQCFSVLYKNHQHRVTATLLKEDNLTNDGITEQTNSRKL